MVRTDLSSIFAFFLSDGEQQKPSPRNSLMSFNDTFLQDSDQMDLFE